MGTELIVAVVGPVVAGMVSLIIWQSKKNTESINTGLTSLHDCVHQVERKVENLSIEVARNNVTREELARHVTVEEDWHNQHHTEVKELRREFNEKVEKLDGNVSEIKDMQWKMRIELLDIKDNE